MRLDWSLSGGRRKFRRGGTMCGWRTNCRLLRRRDVPGRRQIQQRVHYAAFRQGSCDHAQRRSAMKPLAKPRPVAAQHTVALLRLIQINARPLAQSQVGPSRNYVVPTSSTPGG